MLIILLLLSLADFGCTNKVTTSNGTLNVNYEPLNLIYNQTNQQNRGTLEVSEFSLKNTGTSNDTTSIVEIGFFLSPDISMDLTDIYLGSFYIDGLDAGEEYSNSIDLSIPQDIEGGVFYFGMIVDADDSVEETNENDNELTEGEIEIILNPVGYDFALFMQTPFGRDNYMISVQNFDQTTAIDNLVLEIDGNPVSMESFSDFYWTGEYDLTPGVTYDFNLTINSVNYDFDLQICSTLIGNFPAAFDPTEATPVTWTQGANPDYQDFFLEGYDEYWDNSEYNYEILDNFARSFTIPAYWIASTWYEYYMSVWAVNYIVSGDLIALSDEWDGMGYYRGRSGEKTDFGRMERIKKFIENIK